MVPPSDQRLVFSSLIGHDHMSARKSFTLAESVMKPCMEIAARETHGGTIGCNLNAKTAIVRFHRGRQLFRIRCDVVEMQICVHRRCKGYGQDWKWRCCAHKASRTRYCEYPMCRKTLEDKKLENEKENYQLWPMSSKLWMQYWTDLKIREFDELVIEIGGDEHLPYHSEVWWIFRERVMERVWNLRQEFFVWFDRPTITKFFSFAICFGLLD